MIYAEIGQDDPESVKQELKQPADSGWYRRVKIIDLSG